MDVERAQARQGEPCLVEHVAVIEGKNEVRADGRAFGMPRRGVGRVRRDDFESLFLCQLRNATEPAGFTGVIRMAEQQGDLNPLGQQITDTANAGFTVCEYHRTGHGRVAWPLYAKTTAVVTYKISCGGRNCATRRSRMGAPPLSSSTASTM